MPDNGISPETFWKKALENFVAPTPLVVDQTLAHTFIREAGNGEQCLRLTEATDLALRLLSQQHQLSLKVIMQGVWALLLNRYSGEQDVFFGMIDVGTQPVEIGSIVAEPLPVYVKVSPELSLLSWLQQLQAQDIALQNYKHTPVAEIRQWANVSEEKPLFETVLHFKNPESSAEAQLGEQVRPALLVKIQADSPLGLSIVYDQERLPGPAISRMLGHLQTLIEGIVANSDVPLTELPLLTEAERHQLLLEWNDTQVNYPTDVCLHKLFETQVERTPDLIAVRFEGQDLSYRELNQRANQLAHHLQQLGVGPEVLVGVFTERSLEMVIGLYAILKAGGAYVPLDPEYPPERIAFMLEDAQVPVLLTQEHLVAKLPAHGATVLCLDTDWGTIARQPTHNPVSGVTAENLAYVIFTSGSTGRPKGAMNSHRAICNRLLWMQDAYQLTTADRVVQKTPFSFDVSVWEFFWPLLVGARLVVARPGGHRDSSYLVRLIVEERITTIHFVPSMLQVFLTDNDVESCQSLRRVICSGEALPYELQKRFFTRLHAELHNLYGPTEAAVDVTYWACEPDNSLPFVPIGYPVANTQMYVLDTQLQPVPIGVPGELHIGGVQVARGYLNRPELTNEKFIGDPFSDRTEARLYKTGDLACYLPDGIIHYLGRMDFQIKIRGFRVELGEIEAVLAQYPGVREVVVLAREDKPGEKQLVAYFTLVPEEKSLSSDLRRFLQTKLPDYMVPAAFVLLEAFPLTPNGKMNRRALPAPSSERRELDQAYVAPRTGLEQFLADRWREILGIERIGVNDDFFELGGTSLNGAVFINDLQSLLSQDVDINMLFDTSTIAELAAYLTEHYPEIISMVGNIETLQV